MRNMKSTKLCAQLYYPDTYIIILRSSSAFYAITIRDALRFPFAKSFCVK